MLNRPSGPPPVMTDAEYDHLLGIIQGIDGKVDEVIRRQDEHEARIETLEVTVPEQYTKIMTSLSEINGSLAKRTQYDLDNEKRERERAELTAHLTAAKTKTETTATAKKSGRKSGALWGFFGGPTGVILLVILVGLLRGCGVPVPRIPMLEAPPQEAHGGR